MATGERKDPYSSYQFVVEIEGLVVGGFSEVSGLQSEVEIEEYREGGENTYVHRLPKITKYQPLILKRGLTDSAVLWQWHQDVVNAMIKPRLIYVILLDSEKHERWRWAVEDAYPVKWTGPDFKADTSAVALETLEFAHHGLKKI